MKFHKFVLSATALLLVVSCGSKLTKGDADALAGVGPEAVNATIQKIGGVGVDATSAPIDLEPLAKLPAAFARAYAPEVANMLAKTNASQLLTSSLNSALQGLKGGQVQPMQTTRAGTNCGQNANLADADQDGIPDSIVNYIYDCLSNGVLTTGTINVKDKSNGDGPYEVHIKQFKAVNQTNKFSISLNLDLDLKSDTPPYAVAEGISITIKPDDTKADFATVGLNSNLKYTPDNTQNPFNGQGSIELGAGFNFAYKVTDQSNKSFQDSKTFKLTANIHRNNPGCVGSDGEIDTGSVQFSDDAGNFVRTTAVACNSSGWGWETNVK
jgi:hypothetical protein